MFWTAFKYVMAVLAIMLVAGGIIYLLSGVVIKVFEKKNQPKVSEVKPLERREETLLLEDSKTEIFDEESDAQVKETEGNSVDLDLADEEQKAILAQRNDLAERQRVVEQSKDFDEADEASDDDDLNDIYQRMIAEINAEALDEDEKEEIEEDNKISGETEESNQESDNTLADDEIDKLIDEIKDELDEETSEENIVDETITTETDEDSQVEEQQEVVDTEKEDLKKLVEELKQQLAKEQEEKANLEQIKQQKEVEVVDSESIESLNERLEVLTERLAQSEKELKANKKEYLPLLRIKKNLENDKAKLRRKEAVVAKQKVVLFGVNNYVVDPEKEKKLSEDLDVLDALRLSVQHCEEVMKDNEDRYPILEKTNNILTRQVEDLKSDIEDIKQRIAIKQANDNGQDQE